jgi:hypothetical protein
VIMILKMRNKGVYLDMVIDYDGVYVASVS